MARRVIGSSCIRLVAPAAVAVLVAAAGASAQSAQDSAPVKQEHSSKYVLVAADLARVKADNLYDAVRKLRPNFLSSRRGPTTFTRLSASTPGQDDSPSPGTGTPSARSESQPIIVYVDGARADGVDNLRNFSADQVKEVRFIPGPEAAVRYGTDHGGGVLLVATH